MDQAKYQEAQQAYDAGDYRAAAKGFLAAAGRGAVGNGAAFHMAGNSLMRLRRYTDAVTVYGHALRDETYEKHGAVLANLGAAYVALGELTEAVASYERALEQPDYATPYKAHQGIAAANVERGKVEEAALSYRRAALDETNPDPGKALVNLGLCFMALGRPSDGAEAYKAALGFDGYAGRGKALANLGQAYAAMGEYAEAVKAFEKATQLHEHDLSPAARADYETSLAAIAPQRETVDGWVTGEMPPAIPAAAATPDAASGWSADDLASLDAGLGEQYSTAPAAAATSGAGAGSAPRADGSSDVAAVAAEALGFGDEAAVNDFFTRSEDEMKQRDREARRASRGPRGLGLVRAIAVSITGLLLLGVLGAAGYYFGFGWPTQSATVNGLFVAYEKGEPVTDYWVAVPDADVDREMAKVPPISEFALTEVKRGPSTSTVAVTVTPQKGAAMRYVVTLVREGVGWRVSGVEYNWRSTGG